VFMLPRVGGTRVEPLRYFETRPSVGSRASCHGAAASVASALSDLLLLCVPPAWVRVLCDW